MPSAASFRRSYPGANRAVWNIVQDTKLQSRDRQSAAHDPSASVREALAGGLRASCGFGPGDFRLTVAGGSCAGRLPVARLELVVLHDIPNGAVKHLDSFLRKLAAEGINSAGVSGLAAI